MRKTFIALFAVLALIVAATAIAVPPANAQAPNASDHTHDESWTAWESATTLPTAAGKYYLTGPVTLASMQSVNSAKDITLCLNGQEITVQDGARAYRLSEGAVVTICDCQARTVEGTYTAGKIICGEIGTAGAVNLVKDTASGATLNLYDGIITGATVTGSAGSIAVQGGSTFNMYGGQITDSSATGTGGAVYVNASTFNMYGGSITGNTSSQQGGAVYAKNATLTMHSGSIAGNTASQQGGAVCVDGGTFTMHGGSITGNTSSQQGTALYLKSTTFTMNGGAIDGNFATGTTGGGCITAESSRVDILGGQICNNTSNTIAGSAINLTSASKLKLADCTVTGNRCNTASTPCAAIYTPNKNSTIHISGSTVVANNTRGTDTQTPANIYLQDSASGNATITLGALSADAQVYVRTGTQKATVDFITLDNGASTAALYKNVLICENNSKPIVYSSSAFVYREHMHCVCGAGDGTCEHEQMLTWSAWSNSTAMPTASGNYYLTTDVTLTTNWSLSSGEYNICLNGHTITQTGNNQRLFRLSGTAKVQITDCAETVGTLTGGNGVDGAAVFMNDNSAKTSEFTLWNGKITGCQWTGDSALGIVCVVTGVFRMNGGEITGNTAKNRVVYTHGDKAEFNMTGGKIYGNTVTNASATTAALYMNNGTVNLSGGEITGQSVRSVLTAAGTLTISGTAKITGNNISTDGGGVRVNGGTFHMTGGEISGNTAPGGGGLLVAGATATVTGGKITDNNASNGGGVLVTGGTANLTGVQIAGNTASTNGGGLYTNGGTTTVNTEMTGNSAENSHGAAIYVAKGTVTVAGGEISDNTGKYGIVTVSGAEATLNITGGKICDNDVTDANASAVRLISGIANLSGGEISGHSVRGVKVTDGSMTVSGTAKITGNTSTGTHGAGIRVEGGTLTISGGEISDNETTNAGGGVHITGGSVSMTGGLIANNTGKMAGAGVRVEDGTTFTMSGGQITGNTSEGDCGGIYSTANASVTLTGGTVTDNVGKTVNDIVTLGGVSLSGAPVCGQLFVADVKPTVGVLTSGARIGMLTNNVSDKADTVVADMAEGVDSIPEGTVFAANATWLNAVIKEGKLVLPCDEIIVRISNTQVYRNLTDAFAACGAGDVVTLIGNIDENITIDRNVVMNLNGHTVSGSVSVEAGKKLYAYDSSTDGYTVATGKLTATIDDEAVGKVYQNPADKKRYVAVKGGDGSWTFDRFYVGMKSITADINSGDIGYKAIVGGNAAVKSSMADDAFGFRIWVEGFEANTKELAISREEFYTGIEKKLVIANQLATIQELFAEDPTYTGVAKELADKKVKAQVFIRFADNTVVTSATYEYSIVDMYKTLDQSFAGQTDSKKAKLRDLTERFPVMKQWDLTAMSTYTPFTQISSENCEVAMTGTAITVTDTGDNSDVWNSKAVFDAGVTLKLGQKYAVKFTQAGENGVGEVMLCRSADLGDRYDLDDEHQAFSAEAGEKTIIITAVSTRLYLGIQCGNLGSGNSVTVSDISVQATEAAGGAGKTGELVRVGSVVGGTDLCIGKTVILTDDGENDDVWNTKAVYSVCPLETGKTYTVTYRVEGDNGVGELLLLKSDNIDNRYAYNNVAGTGSTEITAEGDTLYIGIQCGSVGNGNSVAVTVLSVVPVE